MTAKKDRQKKIIDLIHATPISNQQELADRLASLEVYANQATISRDLAELGIIKLRGGYQQPRASQSRSSSVNIFGMNPAGPNLMVIKTAPGQAPLVALEIDHLRIDGIVGTVAGDDTIFVALRDQMKQKQAMKEVVTHFQNKASN